MARSYADAHFACNFSYTYWLAVKNCAAFSPAVFTRIQEDYLLRSSNGPPPSANPICPGMSAPLLRYHEESVRRAPGALPLSFPLKRPGETKNKHL
jgi:hypothetical protein